MSDPIVPLIDLNTTDGYELIVKSLAAAHTEDLINAIHNGLRDHAKVQQTSISLYDDPAATDTFEFNIEHPESLDSRPARITIWSAI